MLLEQPKVQNYTTYEITKHCTAVAYCIRIEDYLKIKSALASINICVYSETPP